MSAKPVVYFIDDSATMREVIKIAFRRENMDVITCHDASSAMDMMDHTTPDIVISDVIMPGRDGYEVCQYIKQHPRFGKTPVILMSGVVNKGVAERAFAVQANELIRKPFQPQDLIARVRHLLQPPKEAEVTAAQANEDASAVLSSIFNGPMPGRPGHSPLRSAGPVPVPPRMSPRPPLQPQAPSIAATVAAAMQPNIVAPPVSIPGAQITGNTQLPVPPPQAGRVPSPPGPGLGDASRLRLEILRLHSQVKKLETELVAEREYSKALEEHLNTLAEAE